MAEGNLVAGVVAESVRSDADTIRKIANDIENDMQDYVNDIKNTMAAQLRTDFAEDFRKDLDRIYEEKVKSIEDILSANVMNMNTATDELETYSANSDYNKVN